MYVSAVDDNREERGGIIKIETSTMKIAYVRNGHSNNNDGKE